MATNITPVLTKTEIKAFVQALNALHWKTDYKDFCQIIGFPKGPYSLEKYTQFENLCKAMNNFDIDSLAKLIEAGVIAERNKAL